MPAAISTYLTMSPKAYNFDQFYQAWIVPHCLVGLSGVWLRLINDGAVWWLGLMTLSFLIYLSQARKALHGFPLLLGYANMVTTLRLLIILSTLVFSTHLSPLEIALLLLLAILMDGLDGFLARRFQQTSLFGERLDMETDAFLVAAVSIYHATHGLAPQWIIVPGLMRYFFGLAVLFFKSGGKEMTSKRFRATIAVIFFGSLLTPFVIPRPLSDWVVQIAGGLILLSFGLSFFALMLHQVKSTHR